jgi:uncharacterized protein YegL
VFRLGHATIEAQTYAVMTLHAPEAKRSGGMCVALVLDTSESMQGAPLEAAITAGLSVIESLHEQDEALLVSFSDDAVVECDRLQADFLGKKGLRVALSTLRAYGRTNLQAGLSLATRALRHSEKRRCILLLSDGEPNRGSRDPATLVKSLGSATLSTLGFGEDYDVTLLADIAERGRGTFAHVQDLALMGFEFARALGTVSDMAFDQAWLTIEPGVHQVVKTHTYGDMHPSVQGIRMGPLDVFYGEQRSFVFSVTGALAGASVEARNVATGQAWRTHAEPLSPARAEGEVRRTLARAMQRDATHLMVRGRRDLAHGVLRDAVRTLASADPFLGAELADQLLVTQSAAFNHRSAARLSLSRLPEASSSATGTNARLVSEGESIALGKLTRAGNGQAIAPGLALHRHSHIVFADGAYRVVPEYGAPELDGTAVIGTSQPLTHGATLTFGNSRYRFQVDE